MLKLDNGSPIVGNDLMASMAKKTSVQNPIEFASGETRSDAITKREWPIKGILFELKVTVSGTGGGETVNENGLLNLIKNISIAVDGTDNRVAVKGKHLAVLDWIYSGQRPYDDFTAVANGTYHAYVYVPFDLGGYFSNLYAANNSSLDVIVEWGTFSDIITGGTATVDTASLRATVDYISGGPAAKPGGKGAAYAKQFWKSQTKDISATKSDLEIEDFINGRGYHGLTLFAFDDSGNRADSVVNSLELVRMDSQHMKISGEQIRARNMRRFGLTQADADTGLWKGVYHLDFVDKGHLEHVLAIKPDQAMTLYGDVTKPGGGNGQVDVVSHFIMR